jgi:serine/threonine protein kinase
MSVAIRCPNPKCTWLSTLPERESGWSIECPRCHAQFRIEPAHGRNAWPRLDSTEDSLRGDSETVTHRAAYLDSTVPGYAVGVSEIEPGVTDRLGRFQLRTRLGSGSFGTVYLAFDPHLERLVALKVPRAGTLKNREDRERFLHEARAAGRLTHPRIVPIYEAGYEAGHTYIASAYIEGITLREALADEKYVSNQYRRTARMIRDLAEALAYAHRLGIVHRDLKPGNIVIDGKGRPNLLDFGLAARSEEGTWEESGVVAGTPRYMAPEQARGKEIRSASDQFSLGLIFYELLTGIPAYSGQRDEIVAAAREAVIRPCRLIVPEIPRQLDSVCMRMLSREPSRRYEDLGVVADELQAWLKKHGRVPTVSALSNRLARIKLPAGRSVRQLLAVVVAIAGLVGLAWLTWSVCQSLFETPRSG